MRAVRRFHYEITELRDGDVVAAHQDPGQPQSLYTHLLERHMAVYISPGKYPVGVSGGFWPHELEVIHSIVEDTNGVLLWGGDLTVAEEGLFYISDRANESDVQILGDRQASEDGIGTVGGAGSISPEG